MINHDPVKISLCIPTFNRAYYLEQTLRSIALQTKKPFEVIIIDNASTDITRSVVRKFHKFGFRYIKNKTNIGMIENWNKGLRLAKGTYISILHSDDLIAPTWIEYWQKTIARKKADFYTSSHVIIDKNNNPRLLNRYFSHETIISKPEVIKKLWSLGIPGPVLTGASLFSRKIIEKIGYFNPKFKTEADIPFSLAVCQNYSLFFSNQILFAYRHHDQQGFDAVTQTKNIDEQTRRFTNYFKILSNFYKKNYSINNEFRLFYTLPIFMTLSTTLLYVFLFRFKKFKNYYHMAKKFFPDLFANYHDYIFFIRVEVKTIKNIVMSQLEIRLHPKSFLWLKNLYNN